MIKNKNVCILDLDGCIADDSHRRHFIAVGNAEKRDWDSYYQACDKDSCFPWAMRLLPGIIDYFGIIFITGRPNVVRSKTVTWIDNLFSTLSYNNLNYSLYMRTDGDYTPAPLYKKGVIARLLNDKYQIHFAMDDDNRIADMYKQMNITCLVPWNQLRSHS